jgi:hypothetical protein
LKKNGKNCENSRKNDVYMEKFEIKNLKKKKLFLMKKNLNNFDNFNLNT